MSQRETTDRGFNVFGRITYSINGCEGQSGAIRAAAVAIGQWLREQQDNKPDAAKIS